MGPAELSDPGRAWGVVHDLPLARVDGPEVRGRLRDLGCVAVIMLAAPGAENGRVLGRELGADDHVTEAISLRELVLWVQSVLRRTRGSPAVADRQTLRVADIELDVIGRRAEKGGRPLQLTGREFDLLAYLSANPGRAFTRSELLEKVWGWAVGDRSTVTVHVRRLREKIEADPGNPTLITTVWGVGYRLDPPDDKPAALPPQRMPDAG